MQPWKGMWYRQTHQDCDISLKGAGRRLLWLGMVFLGGRETMYRSKEGGVREIWICLQCISCFYTLERTFCQISLTTSRLNQIKCQQKKPTTDLSLVWEWWLYQPLQPVSSLPSVVHYGSLYFRAIWGSIQILYLWSTSLILITPGLQKSPWLGLPCSQVQVVSSWVQK